MAKNAEPVMDKSGKPLKVERAEGFLYFIDGQGNVMRSPQQRKKLTAEELKKREDAKAKRKAAHEAKLAAGRKKKAAEADEKAARAAKRAAEAQAKAAQLKAQTA